MIVAVIPFYNEKETINSVIQQTLNYVDKIIAVNDGSTDGSDKIIELNDKIILLNINYNSGKGNALKKGFIKSIEIKSEYTVTLDGDFQHPPELIPNLLNEINFYDIVIGSRKRELITMPIQRIISNAITTFLLSLKTGQKIQDSQSGFRIYKTKFLNNILTESSGFEAESEILIRAAKNKLKIGSVKIPTIYNENKSKIKPFEAIFGFIKVLLKY